MKISKQKREEIWEAYKDLEINVQSLKEIIQNDVEISEYLLNEHKTDTDNICKKLCDLEIELRNSAS